MAECKKMIFNDGGIGDAILVSAIAENNGLCVASTKYNVLLENNPNIVLNDISANTVFNSRDVHDALLQQGIAPFYAHYWDLECRNGCYHWRYPQMHMIAKCCARAEVYGDIKIYPRIYLNDQEIEENRPVRDKYIVMQSYGAVWKTAGYETWSVVSKVLSKNYTIVQVGAENDPLLPNTINCLHYGLRETAAVIKNSSAFLGVIGGLMHMARAVGTRSVISFSDSEPEFFSGYIANEHAISQERCDLCRTNKVNMFNGDICPKKYICGKSISPEAILAAFFRLEKRIAHPLEYDVINNTSEKKDSMHQMMLYRKTQRRPVAKGFSKVFA
ncbi:glycosyltransferase family 9 protein [Desulfovibrio sp. 86]|uniref:Glycosyl transferase family 9 n=1 Tax=uncultured Desulfovibrio sp. TaxID=167968 RepID=A0A212L4Q0_9BACT|nr:glycosyltransferase family 9 protein [Desulfovibrio sp. 86]SCM72508.1 hypothetical protein KL86DES1_20663 [uncultured Desulfovibrio sp.]VZH33565.1 conserved protein of unknown function [Desulfovibrio sp. 86]